MPSKYRIILEMASQTARGIASNADRYTDFLITAANNYKYSFKEQLLIHAQKPDATACAEIDTWNKLGRWVNKGTKGIALLIDRDVPYKLRHVFDISDTNSRAGRNITLWQMKPEYEYAVSESLQASFGDVEEPRDFPHLLIDISSYAVEDNLSDYLMELNAVKAGSFLEELDDTSLEAWLKTSLKSSVAFMALSRAGYEPRQYFDREDFSHLLDFNTVEVISVLGAAVSDISEMVIREMGETVKEMEKKEKRKIRTFAQEGASAYHKNRTENKERSNEYTTKTPASMRQVPMLDFVKEAFELEKQKQKDLDIHCEVTIDGYTDFIFINRFGQAQHQATLNKAIRRIIRDCNDEQFEKSEEPEVLLPHFSCHSLRHTFTTRMCEAGVNIKVIQDALGHTDISTTLNIYTDVTKELKTSEFKGLDNYFKAQ